MIKKETVRVESENLNKREVSTACYLRISRCGPDSPQNQINEFISFMDKVDEDNYLILGDINCPGTHPKKPALEEVSSFIKEEKVKTLVVREIARIGRKKDEIVSFVKNVINAGIRFVSINDEIDSAEGIDMEKVEELSKYAEYYSNTASKRSSNALYEKVKSGIPLYHGGPYGYKTDPNNKHKLIPDAETAENVKYIFEKYCELKSTTAVAKLMNEKKVPNPSAYRKLKNGTLTKSELTPKDYVWNDTTIYSILKNVLYTGDTLCFTKSKHFGIKFMANTHEALIDKALFDKVQAILKR